MYSRVSLVRRSILIYISFLVAWQEEIQKKTGYIVMRAEGIYDVDANTSIDQLSEDLNIKMPEVFFSELNFLPELNLTTRSP